MMDIHDFLREDERKDLLRFSTAGSVDDGKSTLIGRLLHDSRTVYEDHLASLRAATARRGNAETGELDYALLTDGLRAEREQGITIDVAYRYFSTPRRKFIIADTPGHEQYTRNMATGASTAELAVILVDARHGVLAQTKRHSFLATLLGIQHLVVAVNKMDLVDHARSSFEQIRRDYSNFAARLEVRDLHFIPISALHGDNVVDSSPHMPWFNGAPLLEYLETVHIAGDRNFIDLRFPVQLVLRPNQDFRGYAGTVASGVMRPGDDVIVLPSGHRTRIARIVSFNGDLEEAFPPLAVTVTLEDDLDVSRGDMLVHPNNLPRLENTLEAMLVWMAEQPQQTDRSYVMKTGTGLTTATCARCIYRIDVNTLHRLPPQPLGLNDIGRVRINLHRPLGLDPYSRNRNTGAFILVDRLTNATVAAGMVLDRAPNELVRDEPEQRVRSEHIRPQPSRVQQCDRETRLGQRAATVWLTGLPRAGKSTIAYALEKRLFDMGYGAFVLDGENLRLGVSADLQFGANDRAENARRAAEIAQLLNQAGLLVIVALVSPYRADRDRARERIGSDRFMEVHVHAPLSVCEDRDRDTGLYRKARSGEIRCVSGVSAPYEPPQRPELVLPTAEIAPAAAVDRLIAALRECGWINS